jgi:hypothetical protein
LTNEEVEMPPWLRKPRVATRYDCETRSVDRAAAEGRLPKPKYPFGNSIPAWDEAELDEHDRAAIAASAAGGGKIKKPPSDEAVAKAKAAKAQKKKQQPGGAVHASQ